MSQTFNSLINASPAMLEGLWLTTKLTLIAVSGGIVIGTLLALARLSRNRWLSFMASFYVNYFRSIPLLLVITWFYFIGPFIFGWINSLHVDTTGSGLFHITMRPSSPVPVGPFASSLIAFMMFEAAYYCEIIRAGIQSISRGQVYAAQALGMNYGQTMRLVILPQAFRKMAPLLLQQSIVLFQDTALVYAVGLMDFFNTARSRGDIIGQQASFILTAGLVYFVICFIASRLVLRLQNKLVVGQK